MKKLILVILTVFLQSGPAAVFSAEFFAKACLYESQTPPVANPGEINPSSLAPIAIFSKL